MRVIPTLKQLTDDILADLQSTIDIIIPFFGKNFLRGLAAVQAGKLRLLYLTLGILQKNIFVDTADPETKGGTLERWGRIKVGRNPYGAVSGQYEVLVTGSVGAIIKASQTFKSNDDSANPGILYVLDNDYTLISTTDSITIRSLTAGLSGKLNIGDKLTATSPIALVSSSAETTVEVIQPLAAESIEDYRLKIEASFRLEAQGGASSDYRLWSFDAQGVKNTYPFARSGDINQIDVYVEATIADSVDGQGTPTVSILNAVSDVIERDPDTTLPINDRGRRPANAKVTPIAVTVRQVDIIIVGYVGNNPTITDLIYSTIKSKVDTIRPFVAAIDILDEQNNLIDNNIIISSIIEARPGSKFTSVTLKIDGVVLNSFEFDLGDIPNLRSVTYL